MCVACHASDVWDEDMKHLFVTAEHLANDVHWQKGILCQGCHGGNAETTDLRSAHAAEDGFRKVGKPSEEPAFCGYCHSDAEKMKSYGAAGATTVVSDFLASTHGQHLQQVGTEKSATCTSCHARHAMRAKGDPASSVAPSALVTTCGQCHEVARDKLLASDHVRAGKKDAQGKTGVLSCLECHQEDPHRTLNVRDAQSPVFVNNQVETCGKCHEAAWNEYRTSVHGEGLEKAGLIQSAVCASCHGRARHSQGGEPGVMAPRDQSRSNVWCVSSVHRRPFEDECPWNWFRAWRRDGTHGPRWNHPSQTELH